MPITISPQNPAGLFGPGITVNLQSDFIGPLPSTNLWHVTATTTPGEIRFLDTSRVSNLNPIQLTVFNDPQWNFATRNNDVEQEGATISINVTIQPSGGGPAADSGQQTSTWTNTAGLTNIIQSSAGSGGGLNSEEHGWLDAVHQFIQNTAAFGGRLGLQTLAGGILEHPDVGLMHECDSPFDLVSGVDLTRPATGIGVNAFGLVLRVAAAPAGAGLRHGAVNEFQTRVAQLVTVHRSASSSTEYVTEVLDLHETQLAWLWRNAYPERIAVDVTPGFTVQATWLCVTLPV